MAPVKVNTLGLRGFELVAMNLDGSNRRQLTDNDRQSDVGIYDFARGTETNLTQTGKDSYPAWSPDGSRIAFLSLQIALARQSLDHEC